MKFFGIFTFIFILYNCIADKFYFKDGKLIFEKCERNVSEYRPKRYIPDDYRTYESLDFRIIADHPEGFDVMLSWTMRSYQVVKTIIWSFATNEEITTRSEGNYQYEWETSGKIAHEDSNYTIPSPLEYNSLYKVCMEYYEVLAYIGYVRDAHLCYYLRLPGNETISKGSFFLVLGPVKNTEVVLSWNDYPELPPEKTPKSQIYFVSYGTPGNVRRGAVDIKDKSHRIGHLLRDVAYEFCLTQEMRVRVNKLGTVVKSLPLCAVIRTDDQLPGKPIIQNANCHYDSYCSSHVCSISWKIDEDYHERIHTYHISWIKKDEEFPSPELKVSESCTERCNVTETVPFNPQKVCVLAKDVHNKVADSCYQLQATDGSTDTVRIPVNYSWWILLAVLLTLLFTFLLYSIYRRHERLESCLNIFCTWCDLLKKRSTMQRLEEDIEMEDVAESLVE